jgi:Big-like domain-containing protein
MKPNFSLSGLARNIAAGGVFIVFTISAVFSQATTLWTGPTMTWTKSPSTPSDIVLPGKIVLTRGTRQVLYNTAMGETATSPDAIGSVSPAGTLWAFGTFASHSAFQTMESMRGGSLASRILNQPMVMWITNDDIFVSVTFTTWGSFGSGTVSYNRSTAPAASAPTVTITNPAPGAVFADPANVKISANATVSSGAVTNVSFFANSTLIGSAQSSPFTFTANGLTAGSYALKAVATAGGLSGTSSVVNISVVSAVDVTLSSATASGGQFSFSYTATPGLRYVVQRSSDLMNWTPIVTNVPPSSPVGFSDSLGTLNFYRVGRLPNP